MTAKELFSYLTQDAGYDEATAKILMEAANNPKVEAKAAALKQQTEYDALVARSQALEASLARASNYEKWVNDNREKIEAMRQSVLKYKERYGDLDAAAPDKVAPAAAGASPDDIKKIVDEQIRGVYGAQWSNLLTGGMKIADKHLRSGRKKELDVEAIAKIAADKYGNDLVKAYDEWDAPDREADQKVAIQKAIDQGVKEELAKRNKGAALAGTGGAPPVEDVSPLSRKGADGKPAYNRQAVIEAAASGKYEGFSVN